MLHVSFASFDQVSTECSCGRTLHLYFYEPLSSAQAHSFVPLPCPSCDGPIYINREDVQAWLLVAD